MNLGQYMRGQMQPAYDNAPTPPSPELMGQFQDFQTARTGWQDQRPQGMGGFMQWAQSKPRLSDFMTPEGLQSYDWHPHRQMMHGRFGRMMNDAPPQDTGQMP